MPELQTPEHDQGEGRRGEDQRSSGKSRQEGNWDIHVYPATYEGMASGIVRQTPKNRRNGRSVRVVNHARPTPSTTQETATTTVSAILRNIRSRVRCRNSNPHAFSVPPSNARITK